MKKIANLHKKIANLYENSDKFTKVTDGWLLAKLGLNRALCFGLKGGLKCYFCHVLAQKNQRNHAKRCRLRAKKTINKGKLQTALRC